SAPCGPSAEADRAIFCALTESASLPETARVQARKGTEIKRKGWLNAYRKPADPQASPGERKA
ncbi:hypothetical protein, partial [Rhizobium leguminosarum]|uniref:hypothetical protein n=1 Tax=Rhizobium leguminosarum TaxID=384 RepID=UPI0019D443CD